MAERHRSTPVDLRATYRIQLREGVDLDAVADQADELAELGVSHLYLSPVLTATPGSTHGYDVTDPGHVDPVLGGDDALVRLAGAVRRSGLGLVVDIVPNHLAASPANPAWRDVLRRGPSSPYARWFDIDWDAPDPERAGTVLLPVLPDHYDAVLREGGIVLRRDDEGEVVARVGGGLDLPLSDESVAELRRRVGRGPDEGDAAAALDRLLAEMSADPDALDGVLAAQHHRVARWQVAADDLDYRRFFDVHDLVGVRVEDPDVLTATHRAVQRWVDDGLVDGLRVDHPDGLRRPGEYLARVRGLAGDRWVVVEKILTGDEPLPPWPVDGTTGYDALARITGLLVDPDGLEHLRALAAELVGDGEAALDADAVARDAELEVLRDAFGTEVRRVVGLVADVARAWRPYRDVTRPELAAAVSAVVAALPVYRTYVDDPPGTGPSDADVVAVGAAVVAAADHDPTLEPRALELVAAVVLDQVPAPLDAGEARARLQQLFAPARAKGVEDTALYRLPALAAVDEVGVEPGHPVVTPQAFHAWCARTQAAWPRTQVTLSTHDTKRSEDVRARQLALTEHPHVWAVTARTLVEVLAHHRGGPSPDPAAELLVLQDLVGAHPIDADRRRTHVTKVLREAKRCTAWRSPDEAVEAEVHAVLDAALADPAAVAALEVLDGTLRRSGRINALAQKLLSLTVPGVPDLYQGSELWHLALVDPDNRRPVDPRARGSALARLEACDPEALAGTLDDPDDPGLAKLAVVRAALALRRERPRAFGPDGTYEPLAVDGPAADHAVAFCRGGEVVVVVPRCTARVPFDQLAATRVALPSGTWRSTLPGADEPVAGPTAGSSVAGSWVEGSVAGSSVEGSVAVTDLWRPLPVALLVRGGDAAC